MSGIPEILVNVQVNHAFLLRVNYENQSVVHNFFDSNLFLLLRVSRIQIRSFLCCASTIKYYCAPQLKLSQKADNLEVERIWKI